ncbi:MAG: MBL fold metallo-hydrolase [Spirochaetota bacterium]
MKIPHVVLILLILVSGCSRKQKQQIPDGPPILITDNLTVTRLTDRVFLVEHHFPWPSNSLLVLCGTSRAVLIDTPYTPDAASQLMSWASEEHGISSFAALNTHFHVDNLGGNAALLDKGYPVYGSDLTASLVLKHGRDHLKEVTGLLGAGHESFEAVFQSLTLIPPDKTFQLPEAGSSSILTLFGTDFEVFYPGPGHTTDNLTVFIPSETVLFGGCLIKDMAARDLGNLTDGDPEAYPQSVKRLVDKYDDQKNLILVPGHGRPGGIELARYTYVLATITAQKKEQQ